MSKLQLLVFAYLCGLTVAGLFSAVLELYVRAPVRFAYPYVAAGRFARSLGIAVVAGPAMLLNEALDARHESDLPASALAAAVVLANLWALASGIVAVQLLAVFSRLLL